MSQSNPFDQLCRTKAIALAARLELQQILSINFLPNAVYRPERCIRTTLQAANEHHFPVERIMFEITEEERVSDNQHIRDIIEYYRTRGFITALDDFGAGYSGLNRLADFQPDIIKLDMNLLRGVDDDPRRQAIVRHSVAMCRELGITVLAEGSKPERSWSACRPWGLT